MKGKKGEVWFVELDKRRPVVIVSNDNVVAELDHTIVTITSQNERNQFDVTLKHWEEAGLDRPSIVRCSKLNTIHNQRLLFKVGKLHEDDFKQVIETIRSYFE